jgi:hypothetical protein
MAAILIPTTVAGAGECLVEDKEPMSHLVMKTTIMTASRHNRLCPLFTISTYIYIYIYIYMYVYIYIAVLRRDLLESFDTAFRRFLV